MNKLWMAALLVAVAAFAAGEKDEEGWISLTDGKTMEGWKVGENSDTWSLKDGAFVAQGPRSHLFYVGDAHGGEFEDFELKVDVKTEPNSNGGVYFHTDYQDEGWPAKGFEVQVNNSHKDWRRSGGLYAVQDVREAPAKDGEWFTEHIIVKGDNVRVLVDGKEVVNWTQPEDWQGIENSPERKLASGTIALQGHDPNSTVYYKNIRIKPLD